MTYAYGGRPMEGCSSPSSSGPSACWVASPSCRTPNLTIINAAYWYIAGRLLTDQDLRTQLAPFLALLTRAFGVLEGIALASDPNFTIIGAAYPCIAGRLLADQDPRMQRALKYLIYGDAGVFNVRRVINLVENVNTCTAVTRGQVYGCRTSVASWMRACAYLEQKRNAFAHSYFVSDGVLLETPSLASDPKAIQHHVELTDITRGDLSKMKQTSVKALITIQLHQQDRDGAPRDHGHQPRRLRQELLLRGPPANALGRTRSSG